MTQTSTHACDQDTVAAFAAAFAASDLGGRAALMRRVCDALPEHDRDGFALFHALRSAQDWVGTVFARSDIDAAVSSYLEGFDDDPAPASAPLSPDEVAQVVAAVANSGAYCRLDETMSERGFTVVYDEIPAAVRAVRDARTA